MRAAAPLRSCLRDTPSPLRRRENCPHPLKGAAPGDLSPQTIIMYTVNKALSYQGHKKPSDFVAVITVFEKNGKFSFKIERTAQSA